MERHPPRFGRLGEVVTHWQEAREYGARGFALTILILHYDSGSYRQHARPKLTLGVDTYDSRLREAIGRLGETDSTRLRTGVAALIKALRSVSPVADVLGDSIRRTLAVLGSAGDERDNRDKFANCAQELRKLGVIATRPRSGGNLDWNTLLTLLTSISLNYDVLRFPSGCYEYETDLVFDRHVMRGGSKPTITSGAVRLKRDSCVIMEAPGWDSRLRVAMNPKGDALYPLCDVLTRTLLTGPDAELSLIVPLFDYGFLRGAALLSQLSGSRRDPSMRPIQYFAYEHRKMLHEFVEDITSDIIPEVRREMEFEAEQALTSNARVFYEEDEQGMKRAVQNAVSLIQDLGNVVIKPGSFELVYRSRVSPRSKLEVTRRLDKPLKPSAEDLIEDADDRWQQIARLGLELDHAIDDVHKDADADVTRQYVVNIVHNLRRHLVGAISSDGLQAFLIRKEAYIYYLNDATRAKNAVREIDICKVVRDFKDARLPIDLEFDWDTVTLHLAGCACQIKPCSCKTCLTIPGAVDEILENLCANSIRFVGRKVGITITVRPATRSGKEILLEYKDNGNGYPASEVDRIRFWLKGRISAEEMKDQKGLGFRAIGTAAAAIGARVDYFPLSRPRNRQVPLAFRFRFPKEPPSSWLEAKPKLTRLKDSVDAMRSSVRASSRAEF